MLPSVEQAFVGRDETRAPLKTPAWEASKCATLCKNGLGTFLTRCFNVHEWTEILFPHVYDYEYNVGTYLSSKCSQEWTEIALPDVCVPCGYNFVAFSDQQPTFESLVCLISVEILCLQNSAKNETGIPCQTSNCKEVSTIIFIQ